MGRVVANDESAEHVHLPLPVAATETSPNAVVQDAKPIDHIPLSNCAIQRASKKVKRPNTFEIRSPYIDKIYYIQANNEAEMEDWMRAIESASSFECVSEPFNVQHNIHVDFCSETGFSVRVPCAVVVNARRTLSSRRCFRRFTGSSVLWGSQLFA